MSKLTRYICLTVLGTSLIVLTVLSSLFVIFTFIAQAGEIGQNGYTVSAALLNIALTLPTNVYLVLPMASLLGSLMGLGLLANRSELTAMRAAGHSIKKIGLGVLAAALILTALGFFLGSYLAPKLDYLARLKQVQTTQSQSFIVSSQSTWLKVGSDFVFIGKTLPNNHLLDVVRYHIVDNQLKTVIDVKHAYFKGGVWQLEGVTTDNISKTGVTQTKQAHGQWQQLITPSLLTVVLSKSNNLTLTGLLTYIHYRQSNHLDASSYQLQFWKMIFNPLSIVILMLLALPFVFGPLRSSHKGLFLVAGVVLGFSFFIIEQFFGPLSLVYKFPPIIGAALPTCVFFMILLLAIWKTK